MRRRAAAGRGVSGHRARRAVPGRRHGAARAALSGSVGGVRDVSAPLGNYSSQTNLCQEKNLSEELRLLMALLQRSAEADVGKFVPSVAFAKAGLSQWLASFS